MGLDIHFAVERKRSDGTWERVESLKPPSGPDVDGGFPLVGGMRRTNLYWTRSYRTFAVLCGFLNHKWTWITPIAPPRGVPSDMSAETRAEWEWWTEWDGENTHWEPCAPSWLTLREMLDHDWPKHFRLGPEGDREILDAVEQMKQYGPPDEVRAVFWFD